MALISDRFISALRPTPKTSPSDWINNNIKTGTDGRPYVAGHSPYWREIVDDLSNDSIETIVIVKSAQIGFSLHLAAMLFHGSTTQTGDSLYLLPSKDKARDEQTKILGLLNRTPTVASQLIKSTTGKFRFYNSTTHFASASNSKDLKSITARSIWADEIDEYPRDVEGEGDPISLAEARTIHYVGRGKKIVLGSTPRRDGLILKKFDECGEQRQFHVPCPHCRVYQPLRFDCLKWQDMGDLSHKKKAQIIESAPDLVRYECQNCKGGISESHKHSMINRGVWITPGSQSVDESGIVRGTRPKSSRVGYKLNALISLFMPWHKLVAGFLASLDDPQSKYAWFSQMLGEVASGQTVEVERFSPSAQLKAAATARAGGVPGKPGFLILAVDQQSTHCPYVLRWFGRESSQLVEHGVLKNASDVAGLLSRRWTREGSGEISIFKCAIDLGGRYSDDMNAKKAAFEIARQFPQIVIPVKGIREVRSADNLWIENIDAAYGLKFLSLQSGLLKDRLAWLQGKNQWSINLDADTAYLQSLDSERKIQTPKGEVWQASGRNDYLDCEIYALGLSLFLNTDTISAQIEQSQQRSNQPDFLRQLSNSFSTR